MINFGAKLQSLRKERGYTQDALAEKLNISPQAVSKWENGATSPDMDTLVKLADIFDVSLDELMGRVVKKPAYYSEPGKKAFDELLLRVSVESKDGDKIWMNLPMPLVKALTAGGQMNTMMGGNALSGIDFDAIVALAEQGALGELVVMDSADGSFHVRVFVE